MMMKKLRYLRLQSKWKEQIKILLEKCIRNDHGDFGFDDCAREKAWKISTVNCLSSADPILDPAVRKTISKMKSGKAAETSVL